MKIGLTRTENPEKHQYYIDWLKANEDIEIITLSKDDGDLHKLNNCDALVLSGGIDIAPKFYGGNPNYPGAPEKFDEERDQFEMKTFQSAQENNLPVLGICRGMQLINVIHKGTLIQHLEDDHPEKTHVGNPDKSHAVHIEKDSILYEIAGACTSPANSAHHQAVDKPGEDLMISARSDEGITEGIERKDKAGKPFLLGIQWHPERMFRFQLENAALSKNIHERFMEEIKKSIAYKDEDH